MMDEELVEKLECQLWDTLEEALRVNKEGIIPAKHLEWYHVLMGTIVRCQEYLCKTRLKD